MYQKNDSALPLVSGFQPMGAFLETRGNQTGNKIVSALKASSPERGVLLPVETRRLDAMETKQASFHSLCFQSSEDQPTSNSIFVGDAHGGHSFQ
jgi:hypothetical protein